LNFLIQQVPNARLQQILEALRLISMPQYQSESIGWLRATLTHTELTSAWHPEEVWTIAEQCGYQASLTWSAVVQDGSFDVLFVRADADTSQLKFSASFHREYCNRSEHLTSDPLHVWRSKKLVPKLREYLVNQLPRHMVPAKIICLHALLKTPGGKIDYGALPVSQVNEATLTEYAASPASLLEAEIAQIWADLLKVNNPSVHADFFALGGHSLLAAQLISRLRDYFGVNISVRQLFEAPTISRLATALSQLLTAGDDDKLRLNLLHLQKRSAPYLLSFSQETIWQRQQLAPNRLRQPIGFALQLSGSLELSALVQALKQVIARHQILRMRLRHSDKEPQPYYVPNDAIEIPLINAEAIDLMTDRGRIQDMLRERMRCPLDLEHKGPFSAEVIQLRRNTYALVLRLHPIAFDGWSVKVLFREIAAALAMQLNGLEATLPTLTLQYSDIARWERQLAVSGGFEAEVNYWQQQLAGVSGSLHLPAPPQSDMGEGHCEFVFERDLVAQVQALAVHKRVTLFTCCLSAYALALACITGVQDLLIVTTSANRRLLEVDEVIGPFANDVPLRLSLNPGNRYTDLLAHARERVIGALVYDNLPFDYLIQRLAQDLPEGYLPVPQTALVMHEEFTPLIDLPGISVSVLDSCGNVFHPFDVRMSLVLVQGELHGRVRFRRCVVDEEFVQTMIAEIQRYLATIAADPDGFIDL
jgi:acyl carrier protein